MKRAWLAFLFVGMTSVAFADEPDLQELRSIGADALPAHDAWERCMALVVRGKLRSERPAGEIAEQALRRCKRSEDRLLSILAKRIGRQKASTVVGVLRDLQRDRLVSAVEELRPNFRH
jgi:hypothetical protein